MNVTLDMFFSTIRDRAVVIVSSTEPYDFHTNKRAGGIPVNMIRKLTKGNIQHL